MRRVIMHWPVTSYAVSKEVLHHYHFVIDGDCVVHEGRLPPEANLSTANDYIAHTRGCNTGAIGVAVSGMYGAIHTPFSAGKFPLKKAQIEKMSSFVACLCNKYSIPVRRDTVLTHAEVQPTLRIPQNGKWDITWLPGMSKPGDPIEVGDVLRKMIAEKLKRSKK